MIKYRLLRRRISERLSDNIVCCGGGYQEDYQIIGIRKERWLAQRLSIRKMKLADQVQILTLPVMYTFAQMPLGKS